MKIISTCIILLAIVLTSLPVAVNAQTRSRYSGGHAVGTSEYYNDDTVILRSRKSFISSVDIHVGRSPEVPGGLKTAPAADEEDVPLEKRTLVATRTSLGNIYIGYLNPIVNGKQIMVRRKKASKKIIAVINCGNWTRELAADYSFESCEAEAGPCIPGKEEILKDEEYISEDGKTKTKIVTTSDGCKTRIEKTVTIVDYRRDEVCVEGAWLDVLEQGSYNGKLGKAFKVSDAIQSLPTELQQKILAEVGKDKVSYLFVQQGACENERDRFRVRWFTKDGGMSKWVYFLAGVGVGFLLGYVIHGTPDKPVFAAQKVQTTPPVRNTPGMGSGSTSGGTIGTRPRRP